MRTRKGTIVFFAVMLAFLGGCGKNKELYDEGRDGYTTITAVDGISFDVMSEAARNGTAITNISEDMSFEPDQTYVFKDGSTQYFIFRMDSIVFVAEKGTDFGLYEAEDKLSAVQNGNIMGIYFTSPRKKLDFVEDEKNGVYKLSATVTAQVAVTSSLYNDFAGRLCYLYNGDTEWTLFVGSIGNDFHELKKESQDVITYMAASMKLCDTPEEQPQKEPAVSIGGEEESTEMPVSVSDNNADIIAESPDISAEEAVVSSRSDPETTEMNGSGDAETAEDADQPADPENDTDDMLPQTPVEVIEVEEIEETPAGEESTDKEQDSDEAQQNITENAALPENVSANKATVKADNQKKAKASEDGTVYQSDIYSQISLGEKAYATALMSKDGFGRVEVCADRILVGEEAQEVIRNAYNGKAVYGNYFDPPEGCSWHVLHYSVAFPTDQSCYLNVKLRGMDGEDLKYRGITYPHRAYDIKVSETEFYAFYAVPNGCPEYVLEIGEGHVGADAAFLAAYYRYEKNQG